MGVWYRTAGFLHHPRSGGQCIQSWLRRGMVRPSSASSASSGRGLDGRARMSPKLIHASCTEKDTERRSQVLASPDGLSCMAPYEPCDPDKETDPSIPRPLPLYPFPLKARSWDHTTLHTCPKHWQLCRRKGLRSVGCPASDEVVPGLG